MKFITALFLGLVASDSVDNNSNYIPPYADDDPFLDDEDFGIDEHDDNK
jgi:hypothetical protein